jgi:hypothetical protein
VLGADGIAKADDVLDADDDVLDADGDVLDADDDVLDMLVVAEGTAVAFVDKENS